METIEAMHAAALKDLLELDTLGQLDRDNFYLLVGRDCVESVVERQLRDRKKRRNDSTAPLNGCPKKRARHNA